MAFFSSLRSPVSAMGCVGVDTMLRCRLPPRPGSPSQGAFEAALATVERRRPLGTGALLNFVHSEEHCLRRAGFWGKSRSF